MSKANYKYEVDPYLTSLVNHRKTVYLIKDLFTFDNPTMSVTNDAEDVLADIDKTIDITEGLFVVENTNEPPSNFDFWDTKNPKQIRWHLTDVTYSDIENFLRVHGKTL